MNVAPSLMEQELNVEIEPVTKKQQELVRVIVDRIRNTPETKRGKWLALLAKTINALVESGITVVRANEVHRAMVAIAPGDPRIRTPMEVGKDMAARGFNFAFQRDSNWRYFAIRKITSAALLKAILSSKIAD